jgi:AcrR family transcriptional regulator
VHNYALAVDPFVTLESAARGEPGPKDNLIIDTVLAQIETVGYDGVELRAIARDARASLATVYKSFPSRDALLLAVVKRWMTSTTTTSSSTRSASQVRPDH